MILVQSSLLHAHLYYGNIDIHPCKIIEGHGNRQLEERGLHPSDESSCVRTKETTSSSPIICPSTLIRS